MAASKSLKRIGNDWIEMEHNMYIAASLKTSVKILELQPGTRVFRDRCQISLLIFCQLKKIN